MAKKDPVTQILLHTIRTAKSVEVELRTYHLLTAIAERDTATFSAWWARAPKTFATRPWITRVLKADWPQGLKACQSGAAQCMGAEALIEKMLGFAALECLWTTMAERKIARLECEGTSGRIVVARPATELVSSDKQDEKESVAPLPLYGLLDGVFAAWKRTSKLTQRQFSLMKTHLKGLTDQDWELWVDDDSDKQKFCGTCVSSASRPVPDAKTQAPSGLLCPTWQETLIYCEDWKRVNAAYVQGACSLIDGQSAIASDVAQAMSMVLSEEWKSLSGAVEAWPEDPHHNRFLRILFWLGGLDSVSGLEVVLECYKPADWSVMLWTVVTYLLLLLGAQQCLDYIRSRSKIRLIVDAGLPVAKPSRQDILAPSGLLHQLRQNRSLPFEGASSRIETLMKQYAKREA